MAQYRNVSGVDRILYLQEWFAGRLVEADAVVDIPDDVARRYDFRQPGVWEEVTPPASTPADPVGSNQEGDI